MILPRKNIRTLSALRTGIISILGLTVLVCCMTPPAYAQNWAGVLGSSRAIDWSHAGVPGGIPNRTTICATLSPGATAAQINSAIQNCNPGGNGGVVQLNAGTYNLTSGITFNGKSNVTLRGAGPDQTILVFTGQDACTGYGANICVRGSAAVWPPGGVPFSYNLTGATNWPKGTTQATLNSVAGLSVGMILFFDQLNDAPSNLSTTPGILVCDTVNICSQEGSDGTRPNRNQQQPVQITAINGNTISFTPGLYMPNWRASQSPQAWGWGNLASTATMDGVESLTVDGTNSPASGNIVFTAAFEGWVKNVRSLNAGRSHVWLYGPVNIEVRDSYFYGSKNAGVKSYGVETYSAGGNHLIINNIFQHIPSPVLIGTTIGTVVAYNYAVDEATSCCWMWQSLTTHNAGVQMVLFEGNSVNSLRYDTFHATSDMLTAFRNRLTGTDPGRTGNTIPVNDMAGSRYNNAVGNILGTAAYHTHYQQSETVNSPEAYRTVYVNGFTGAESSSAFGSGVDPFVNRTFMRWGNYDTVTGTVQFDSAEIPSGLSDYPNPVPSSRTLPASFFLPGKPGWWPSAIPWPAIGPDVTGGPGPGGHSYLIPAENCYLNVMHGPTDGSATVATFNANKCFQATTTTPRPAAPTGLKVNVK